MIYPNPTQAARAAGRGRKERTGLIPWGKKIAVVSGEFSKKADHGKWFGAKAKNHQRKEYHDPPKAER